MFSEIIKVKQLQHSIIYIIKNNLLNLNNILVIGIFLKKPA